MVPIRKGYWIRQFRFGPVTNLFCSRKRMVKNIEVKTNVPLTSPKNTGKKKKGISVFIRRYAMCPGGVCVSFTQPAVAATNEHRTETS